MSDPWCSERWRPGDMIDQCFVDRSWLGQTVPNCVYCDSMESNPEGVCALTYDPASANAVPQCGAVGGSAIGGRGPLCRPGMKLTGQTALDYDCLCVAPTDETLYTPWYAQSRPEAIATPFMGSIWGSFDVKGRAVYLLKPITLLVDPCHGFSERTGREYCCMDGQGNWTPNCSEYVKSGAAIWLCRAFLTHESLTAWRMWCNRPAHVVVATAENPNPSPVQDQGDPRALTLDPDFANRRIMRAHFTMGESHACWPLLDWACLGYGSDPLLWSTETQTDRVNMWSRLYFDPDIGVNTDVEKFPHMTASRAALINRCWATFRGLQDEWQVTHTAQGDHKSAALNKWSGGFEFAHGAMPTGSSIPEYPTVLDDDGEPIEIRCKSVLGGVTFPATLTMHSWSADLYLNLDPGPLSVAGEPTYRVFATFDIRLILRVKLATNIGETPGEMATWLGYPFTLFDPTNPYDLRVAHPTTAGAVHPHEAIYPQTAEGDRVPHKAPDQDSAGVLWWRGIKGPAPFARGGDSFREVSYPDNVTPSWVVAPCCQAAYVVHGLVIEEEPDNFADHTGPQRYTGCVTLLVPDFVQDAQGYQTYKCYDA